MEIDMSLSCTVKAARRAPQTTQARLLSMAQCRWQHAAKEAGAARSIRSAKSPLLSLYLRACAWFLLPPHGMVCAAQRCYHGVPWLCRTVPAAQCHSVPPRRRQKYYNNTKDGSWLSVHGPIPPSCSCCFYIHIDSTTHGWLLAFACSCGWIHFAL